jgi:RNA polymerase II-associated factor 1
MLVGAEMGMPLDLNQYDGVWEGRYETMNPRPDAGRVMHPSDLALLAPLNTAVKAPSGLAGSTVRDVKIKDEDLVTLRTSNAKAKRALGRRRSTQADIKK